MKLYMHVQMMHTVITYLGFCHARWDLWPMGRRQTSWGPQHLAPCPAAYLCSPEMPAPNPV